MAANFWTSSHYKQLLDQEDVDVAQPLDREKGITVEDYKLIKMQMSNYSDEKYRYEVKDILEMEMKILEALNYYLVVFHPYRSLVQGILNDTYKMDLILVHPPHLIALACIYIASVYREKDNTAWFEELRVDMNVVKNISMEILDFYENQRLIPPSVLCGFKVSTPQSQGENYGATVVSCHCCTQPLNSNGSIHPSGSNG
ncbi:Cyclin-C1-2 [Citrus sinensis]|nr:Cyclin-C1-2 [Citrus sinensis]